MKKNVIAFAFVLVAVILTGCSFFEKEEEKKAEPTYGMIQFLNESSVPVTALYIMPYSESNQKAMLDSSQSVITRALPSDYYYEQKCETGKYMIAFTDSSGTWWLFDKNKNINCFTVGIDQTISVYVEDTSWGIASSPFTSSSVRRVAPSIVTGTLNVVR